MTYLLDTSAAVAILRNRPSTVRDRLRKACAEGVPITTSSIVLFELWYGVARSADPRPNAERLRIFLSGTVDAVAFAAEDAATAGQLRASLAATGAPIGPYDLLIAAQALRSGATLVTASTRELARVAGLAWQDWTREDEPNV